MGALDSLKEIADLVKKAGDIDLYRKITESEDEVRELTRENRQLEDRVEQLQEALRFKEKIVFKAPFYFQKEGDQTPYCGHCWDKNRMPIHVVMTDDGDASTHWHCPACKQHYRIEKAQNAWRGSIGEHGPWS